MTSVVAILNTVETTNKIIKKIERQEEPFGKISLFLRRQVISDHLNELDHKKIDPPVPNTIRRGEISSLLSQTAGLGAIYLAGIGPVIITGKLGDKYRAAANGNIHQLLTSIGLSRAEIRYYLEKLRKKAILLIVLAPSSPQKIAQILRQSGAKNITTTSNSGNNILASKDFNNNHPAAKSL